MRLGKSLVISFVLLLLINLCFFASLYSTNRQAENLGNWVIHTHMVIAEVTTLNTLINSFEAEDQVYIITNNKDYKKNFESNEREGSAVVNRIKILTADNPVQRKNIRLFQEATIAKIKYRDSIFNVLRSSPHDALLSFNNPRGGILFAEIKKIIASMLNEEHLLLKQRTSRYKEAMEGKYLYSVGFVSLILLLLLISFWKIYRESINRKLAEEEKYKNELKYNRLIEKSSLIIFTTDLHGHLTYISKVGCELTGYTMKELIGKPFTVLIPESQKRAVETFYLNQYKDFSKHLMEEFEIKTKENKIKSVQLSTVLLEENGKIVGFQSIARDISHIKYVEKLIKESKEKLEQQQVEYNMRLQAVLNNIPLVLYIKDLEGRYLMVNKNFSGLSDVSEEIIVGKNDFEIPQFIDKAQFYSNIDQRVLNAGKPIEFEEIVTSNNVDRNFLVTKFPLIDKNNNIFAIGGVAKDITDMTYHWQQLIDARMKAEKAEQLQEAFLANMSHEIRTPMNGIIGMTNMLLDTNLDNEQKEFAQLIKISSDTLLILINDILDLSKIKAGRMELEIIDFNIKAAIQNMLQPMKLNLKENLVLECKINNEVPEWVKGDSHKLFQILNNLVSNAVKFTEKGRIVVAVDVVEKNDEEIRLKFDISDTGIGISPEYIKNIFENFTQAGNDTVRRFGGTGLGLAITKKLTELQNGTIEVESKVGEGSVFHVEIPYLLCDTKYTNPEVSSNSEVDFKKDEVANKRVLIAEDNIVNQRVLTSVLQKIKVSWDIANNGKEAIEKLESGAVYDLIIMDLQMPVMNGFEATEHIRKKMRLTTPIIAMTASTLRNERLQCMEMGMNDYLAKPFSPDELITHIHNLINPADIKEKQMEQQQVEEKYYDLAYLHELEDNDYVIEMLELFFETTMEALEEIQKNIKKKNWDVVSKESHKLKSSLGPLQINKMITTASALEEKAKDPTHPDEIIILNKELNNQYNIVKPLLEAELRKAKKMSNGFVASA